MGSNKKKNPYNLDDSDGEEEDETNAAKPPKANLQENRHVGKWNDPANSVAITVRAVWEGTKTALKEHHAKNKGFFRTLFPSTSPILKAIYTKFGKDMQLDTSMLATIVIRNITVISRSSNLDRDVGIRLLDDTDQLDVNSAYFDVGSQESNLYVIPANSTEASCVNESVYDCDNRNSNALVDALQGISVTKLKSFIVQPKNFDHSYVMVRTTLGEFILQTEITRRRMLKEGLVSTSMDPGIKCDPTTGKMDIIRPTAEDQDYLIVSTKYLQELLQDYKKALLAISCHANATHLKLQAINTSKPSELWSSNPSPSLSYEDPDKIHRVSISLRITFIPRAIS